MDDLLKKAFDRIIDELVEKGTVEVEIRAILNEQNGKIHNLVLILKDKVEECDLADLKDRVLILEQEQKMKTKNKTAMIALFVATIGALGLIANALLQYFTK